MALKSAQNSCNYEVMERLVSERLERKPTSPQNHKWLSQVLNNVNKKEDALCELQVYKEYLNKNKVIS